MNRIPYLHVVIVWKLKETMARLGVTQYALQRDSGLALNTIRSIHNGKTERPDLKVVNTVINTLRSMTGTDIRLADVLEYREDAGRPIIVRPAQAPAGAEGEAQ